MRAIYQQLSSCPGGWSNPDDVPINAACDNAVWLVAIVIANNVTQSQWVTAVRLQRCAEPKLVLARRLYEYDEQALEYCSPFHGQ